MAFDTGGDDDEVIANINFIPMIDISLVLLIIFMVATTFVNVTGIDLKLPKATTAKNSELKTVTIQVSTMKDVFLNGEKITLDILKAGINEKLIGAKDRSVVVNIDSAVDYGLAVKVMDIVNQADAAIILATEIDK
ncbi:biopolymer transporter ExbD [Verrucomicrobiota bacterium]|nr:biopolymer transporter ExbD [Verrucomicrobiota bacterium]